MFDNPQHMEVFSMRQHVAEDPAIRGDGFFSSRLLLPLGRPYITARELPGEQIRPSEVVFVPGLQDAVY